MPRRPAPPPEPAGNATGAAATSGANGGKGATSGKGLKGFKQHLPSKLCTTCGRPMAWRRAWARCWDEVKHCSDACRRQRKPSATDGAKP